MYILLITGLIFHQRNDSRFVACTEVLNERRDVVILIKFEPVKWQIEMLSVPSNSWAIRVLFHIKLSGFYFEFFFKIPKHMNKNLREM